MPTVTEACNKNRPPDHITNPVVPVTAWGQPLVTEPWAFGFDVLGIRVIQGLGLWFRV